MSGLFHKNKNTGLNNQSSTLLNNPLLNNAQQMNNQFLNSNKQQQYNSQGILLQQPYAQQQSYSATRSAPLNIAAPVSARSAAPSLAGKKSRGHHHGIRNKRAQAVLPTSQFGGPAVATLAQPWQATSAVPVAPVWQSAPAWQSSTTQSWQSAPAWQSSTTQSWQSSSSATRGLQQQLRSQRRLAPLRTRNWGSRTENGWSGFNSWSYQSQNLASWEPKNIIVEELRAQHMSQRNLAGGIPLVKSSSISTINTLNTTTSNSQLNVRPTQYLQTLMKPTIYQDTLRTDKVVHVQPVVHRQIDQPIINHIEKHIQEARAANLGGIVRLAPVIQEVQNTRVIDEITPVLHREVAVTQIERVEEHLQEHVVAPVQHTRGVQYERAALPAVALAAPMVRELPNQQPTILPAINHPAIHQSITKAPVFDQTIRTDRVVQVQPIVHREIEQSVINHIEKHSTEAPTPAMGGIVRMLPIVQETHNTRVVEEVQPIVHRERVQVQQERVEEHLQEHIVAPTQHTRSAQYESAPLPAVPLAAPIARALPNQQPTMLPTVYGGEFHQTLTKSAVVEESIRTDRLVQVQPVVHREVDQQIVNHIERHITEAPAPSAGGIVRMAPIMQETHNTRVIEEVQPIVHRETVQVQSERVEEHIVEHFVAPTQHTKAVVMESVALAPAASSFTSTTTTSSLNSAPLVNTTNITEVVPNNLFLEKRVDTPLIAKPTYGAAMM